MITRSSGTLGVLWLVAAVVLLSACSPNSGEYRQNANPQQIARGRQLFSRHCAPCHGELARGGSAGPDLAVSSFKYGKTRRAVMQSITDGRPGGMPAFGMHLQVNEISALSDFLLQL